MRVLHELYISLLEKQFHNNNNNCNLIVGIKEILKDEGYFDTLSSFYRLETNEQYSAKTISVMEDLCIANMASLYEPGIQPTYKINS